MGYQTTEAMDLKAIRIILGVSFWEKEKAEACASQRGTLSPVKRLHIVRTACQTILQETVKPR